MHHSFIHHPVLVINMGAQYSQLIARKIREAGVYSMIVGADLSASELLAKNPAAIVISGGPSSVYQDNAPKVFLSELYGKVPILGICYGFQLLATQLGGTVEKSPHAEYGKTEVQVQESLLFTDTPATQNVWMSHSDKVTSLPENLRITSSSKTSAITSFEDAARKIYAVQWHPEVTHCDFGFKQLQNFLTLVAKIKPTWEPGNIIEELILEIRRQVGDRRALCALSGGVDSSVAAALVSRAIGDRLTCIFIDHGLLRKNEARQVMEDYAQKMGIRVLHVDESKRFLSKLKGVTDPEQKRKIIGEQFIRSFEDAVSRLLQGEDQGETVGKAANVQLEADTKDMRTNVNFSNSNPKESATTQADQTTGQSISFLVQGTLYPDVVESGATSGSANIKSHHNVGGLPQDLSFELVEPLRRLFKDEVRCIGKLLGVPAEIIERHPFPGPGLAIRIIGEVNEEHLRIIRECDFIVHQLLREQGLYQEVWQFPVVLLTSTRSVGVQGDGRSYGYPVVLRPVSSSDGMTANTVVLPQSFLEEVSHRITSRVPKVNRVLLDLTSKPPATIEWE